MSNIYIKIISCKFVYRFKLIKHQINKKLSILPLDPPQLASSAIFLIPNVQVYQLYFSNPFPYYLFTFWSKLTVLILKGFLQQGQFSLPSAVHLLMQCR